jgi:hypothetical protein
VEIAGCRLFGELSAFDRPQRSSQHPSRFRRSLWRLQRHAVLLRGPKRASLCILEGRRMESAPAAPSTTKRTAVFSGLLDSVDGDPLAGRVAIPPHSSSTPSWREVGERVHHIELWNGSTSRCTGEGRERRRHGGELLHIPTCAGPPDVVRATHLPLGARPRPHVHALRLHGTLGAKEFRRVATRSSSGAIPGIWLIDFEQVDHLTTARSPSSLPRSRGNATGAPYLVDWAERIPAPPVRCRRSGTDPAPAERNPEGWRPPRAASPP